MTQELGSEEALLFETYGLPLLAYICALDEVEMMARLESNAAISDEREQVLAILRTFAGQVAAGDAAADDPFSRHLEILGQFEPQAGTSVANVLRQQAGGTIAIELHGDPVVDPLLTILRDVYPVLLGQRDDSGVGPGAFPFFALNTHHHPRRKEFEAKVVDDADLTRLFVSQEGDDRFSMTFRSTGSGGTVQLWGFSDRLIGAAWSLARFTQNKLDLETVASCASAQIDVLRRAARGDECQVPALIAFTGVVFEETQGPVELPVGTLRRMRNQERGLNLPGLEGQVQTTLSTGETITATYSGDIVLETSLPYQVKALEHSSSQAGPMDWPADLDRSYEIVERHVETLTAAGLLSVDPSTQGMMTSTWRLVLDPLSHGPQLSWNDRRQQVAPVQLTAEQVDNLKQNIDLIHRYRRPSFEVALRRFVSASASRIDPGDAVLDLVIAWENLFGSTQGEPTLRISASLAWLLGKNGERRRSVRKIAAKIYAVRSDIVHGNRAIPPEEAQQVAVEAKDLTHRTFIELFHRRPELLALANGAERSLTLLLDAAEDEGETDSGSVGAGE